MLEPRLFEYRYKYSCQGTDEEGTDIALVYVPKDASFESARSTLVNERYQKYNHEIILESVVDKTIRW